MSIAEAIFAVIGALSSLVAVTVIVSLIIHSAWSNYREKMRARRERNLFRDAHADLEALDDLLDYDDPDALIDVLKGGSDRRAA